MSKEPKYLDRLNELFSRTEIIDPEPWDYLLPRVEPEKVQNSQVNKEKTSGTSTPVNGDSKDHDQGTAKENAKVSPRSSKEIEQDGNGSSLSPTTKVGWGDFLDAIKRDEQVSFRYDIDRDEIIRSDAAGSNSAKKGNQNIMKVPLSFGSYDLGTVELESSADNNWGETDTQLVADIIQKMGLHLDNLRLISQAEQYREEAEEAVRRLTRAGWEDYLVTQNKPISGYIYDRKRVVPLEEPLPDKTVPLGEGSSNGNKAKNLQQPLIVRDETIGELVLETGNGSVGAELLEAVAERLSTHIESLRLLEETELSRQQLDRRAAELETVAKVSIAAATILERDTLLQAVVDLTKENFKLYHAHIYLLDEHTPHLDLVAASGEIGRAMVADQQRIDLEKSQGCVAKAARYRNGVIVQDVRNEPDYRPYHLLPDGLSELSVPMIVGEQVLGVFGVLSERVNRFSLEEMRIFSTLAAQVAVAMRNAELYAEQTATVERLRELDHLKSAFLANMSHELRTPLNSILGFAQVILEGIDGPLTEEMENDLHLIAKNGKHLLDLINDVLDMAKIEAGRMSLVLEPFDLHELLEDVLQTTEPLVRNKSLYLGLEMNPTVEWKITADRFRMRQIVLNLVANAIKFTESGGVTVQAEKREKHVLVSIRDTGIGIPEDQLESIFEAFSQVDSSTTRKAGGTGLGLPISRSLVELHGGRLWAESSGNRGEGSTLWLKLPIEAIESTN